MKYTFMKLRSIITGGFAAFAMFFGAGNLVFPLLTGKEAGSDFLFSFIGLCLTGIFVPFLGLLGILLYNGSYQDSFEKYGKTTAFVLISFMLLLLGPLGVLPRCITVAYGSFAVLQPSIPLYCFSLVLSAVVFLLCLNQNRVVPWLGAILAPAKILSVGFILVFALLCADIPQTSPHGATAMIKDGALKGYQMMDLIAGFFFATVIAKHFKHQFGDNEHAQRLVFSLSLQAMLVGSGLLTIVYLALVYLGATFASDLGQNPPEQYLSIIAHVTLGNSTGRIVTVAIILSCLTTIVALTTVFTDFLFEKILQKRVHRSLCLAMTVAATYLISTIGFSGIVSFLNPILFYLYPLLILLTITNITIRFWQRKRTVEVS